MNIADCQLLISDWLLLKCSIELETNRQWKSAINNAGEVQEWLNWQHWKCCERGTVPWVRIPPSPPSVLFEILNLESGIGSVRYIRKETLMIKLRPAHARLALLVATITTFGTLAPSTTAQKRKPAKHPSVCGNPNLTCPSELQFDPY